MSLRKFAFKFFLRFLRFPLWIIAPQYCTKCTVGVLKKLGAKISGVPNYLSAQIWFDGDDYSNISIGHGVTISSNVRILTHDWSPYTVAKSIYGDDIDIKGFHKSVCFDDYCFVGTGSLIMPGARIGRGAIIGAGSVVRGVVPDYALYIGNPGVCVGDSRKIVKKCYGDLA